MLIKMFSYDKQHDNIYFYAKIKNNTTYVAFEITSMLNSQYFECIIVQSVWRVE